MTDITGAASSWALLSFNWVSLWSVMNPAPLPSPQSLSISSGEIIAGPSVGGADFCTHAFRISGTLLPAGTFSGMLKHYGEKINGTCEADFASVTVTVTTP